MREKTRYYNKLKIAVRCVSAFFMLLAVICAVGLSVLYYKMNVIKEEMLAEDTITSNVFIGNVPVTGMSRSEAIVAVTEAYGAASNQSITIVTDTDVFEFGDEELSNKENIANAVETAYQIGKQGTDAERLEVLYAHLQGEMTVIPVDVIDLSDVYALADELEATGTTEAVDATLTFVPDSKIPFNYTEAVSGKYADVDALRAWLDGLGTEFGEAVYPVSYIEIPPEKTMEQLFNETQKLSELSTYYGSLPGLEIQNIEAAASSLDGIVLLPGQQISFNDESDRESGGYNATADGSNITADTVGCGLEGLASLLYCCALQSDLTVNTRSAASSLWEIDGVPSGFEADIFADDLVITNSTMSTVYIVCKAQSDMLTVTIYGTPADDWDRIVLQSESVPSGEGGVDVFSYRYYYQGDTEVTKECVSETFYN